MRYTHLARARPVPRRPWPSVESDAIYRHGLALVLECHRRTRRNRRRIEQCSAKIVGDENLTRTGFATEPARGVHDVADDGKLEPSIRANIAGERLAVVEANAHLQFGTAGG